MKKVYESSRKYLAHCDAPWIQFLLQSNTPENSTMRNMYKSQTLSHPQVQSLITTCLDWPDPPLKRHNDAKHALHQMHILLDFGLDRNDEPIQHIANQIMEHQAEEGPFLSQNLIPKHFGGSGEPSFSWLLCDTPLLLHFLIQAGYRDEPDVQSAIDHLASMADETGWRCKGSFPKFHGPGNRNDFCPFANLISLKVFSQLPEYHHEKFILDAIDSIFWHWLNTEERKVYLFAMGTHFRRLKYPLIWYDILDVCHTLSYFPHAHHHAVYQEMMALILEKQQPSGGFIPESVFLNFKDWDFGQKKVESPMLTWKVYEMLKTLDDSKPFVSTQTN